MELEVSKIYFAKKNEAGTFDLYVRHADDGRVAPCFHRNMSHGQAVEMEDYFNAAEVRAARVRREA